MFFFLAGKICLDLLRMPPTGSYNPAITLESILISIQLLLANPNPNDPLQGDAADLYKSNKQLFNKKAKDLVKKLCSSEATASDSTEDEVTFKSVEENKDPLKEGVERKKLKLNLA